MDARLEAVLERLPQLGPAVEIDELTGGLTNSSFKLTTRKGVFVVRVLAPDGDVFGIDREAEIRNTGIAADVGVGARVVAHDLSVGVLVTQHLEGRTLCAEDIRAGAFLDEIVDSLRRLHGGPSFAGGFDMFERQQRFERRALSIGVKLPDRYLDYGTQIREIRAVLEGSRRPQRPCHNDLVPSNMLATADGVRIIDYEYAGNNDPSFDLGSVWTESQLEPMQLESMVERYVGTSDDAFLARSQLWSIVANYGWALWGLIRSSDPHRPELREWALVRFRRAAVSLASEQLPSLRRNAAR